MIANGIFITGTDTGVGKTIVSAAIIRGLIRKGIKVGAMKPIETGCRGEFGVRSEELGVKEKILIPSDGMFLRDMAEMDDPIDIVTPLRYEQPLAPMVASELERKPVELQRVMDAYEKLSKKYDFMVVEGVGGLLVPIARLHNNRTYFVADLIKDLNLPAIVVCRPSLGTINHTLLTVEKALREGISVKGMIINYHNPPENTIAEKTNPDVLRELCPVPLLGIQPYIRDINVRNIEDIALAGIKNAIDFIAGSG